MGFQYQHAYLTIKGSHATGAENWQFGLRVLDTTTDSTETSIALAAAPIVENWWRGTGYTAGTNKVQWLDSMKLEELKVAKIDYDGTYLAGSTSYSHFYLPAIAGTYTTWSGWMPQAATCVTLTTGVPRGLASHGRIYLPPNDQQATGTDGRITAASALIVANSIKKLINDLNALTAFGPVMVMSKGHGVKVDDVTDKRWEWTYPNTGVSAAVTGTRVGRVVDTMRRRRRALIESPQGVQLA
jgi:hypothetical protein